MTRNLEPRLKEPVILAENLPSAYNPKQFSDVEYAQERQRVLGLTKTERDWIEQGGLKPYKTDGDILSAEQESRLVRITWGVGFQAISRLVNWESERSDPEHTFHYSPPFLSREAAYALQHIGREWAVHDQNPGPQFALAVTSMTRSQEYQEWLLDKAGPRKLAAGDSTHTYGWAFDIDGCGLYLRRPNQDLVGVNPGKPEAYNEHVESIAIGRHALREILDNLSEQQRVHYIEELPGTRQHVFHVAVNPKGT